jgi:hypothetical protein
VYLNPKLGIKGSSLKAPKSPVPEKEVEIPRSPHFPVKIVVLWSYIFIAMVLYTFVWFTLGLPLIFFVDAIRTSMPATTDAMWLSVADFIILCFEIHPIISLIGWFIYGILNSSKRDVDTWRTF